MMLSRSSTVAKIATIIAIIYLAIFFALSSGLVNSIIEGANINTFIVPSRSVQTLGETIVTTMILFMGMAGAFLLFKAGGGSSSSGNVYGGGSNIGSSSSQGKKAQQALLIAGFVVIGIALVLGFTLVNAKL